ncbi:type IIG restriction enzyme/methyltransferase [Mucilaginibacter sp.]
MHLKPVTPKQALNKAYLKEKVNRADIELFKKHFADLLNKINDKADEEHLKSLVADFLKFSWYKDSYQINPIGKNDLVIHTGKSPADPIGVILEVKSVANKTEMLSEQKPNTKALRELILYYLTERITHNRHEIKQLIATNIFEWYIIDANEFDKKIYRNTAIKKLFEQKKADNKDNPWFYAELEKLLADSDLSLEAVYFDIRTYSKYALNDNPDDDTKLIPLFKILSPVHLLKLSFANDSNTLQPKFYSELLHIIGLYEYKEGSKKLISRKKEGERNPGSLLENTITNLDSHDKISRLDRPSQYGETYAERQYTVALELVITWVNRILFLKLLEAQLLNYHKGDKAYTFLNKDKIRDFDDLDKLFFRVLAKRPAERSQEVMRLFGNVPYLNSSLFEPTELEHQTLFINNLEDNIALPLLSATVLKDGSGKTRKGGFVTLDYLFDFLNAYDFSSEGAEEIQEDNKTLINASVLGLIFEKINGYKDGSFFTPGFITMYMCRETIRRAVVQKFNEAKGWELKDYSELYDRITDRHEANSLINSLKICDPAVGSGHFLVSALNELIAIKSDLNILMGADGRTLRDYRMEVVNDELIVLDENNDPFKYHYKDLRSQTVQQTLFHEKQTLIENCLFGVDINPNSVKICRLRLWIELLKNAYYKTVAGGLLELETLPNIDINIKTGNSLISRFALDADLKQALKKNKISIEGYRNAVATYRNARDKEQKREMEGIINTIKSNFRTEIARNDPKLLKLNRQSGELYNLTNQQQLFGESRAAAKERKLKQAKLEKEVEALRLEVEEIKNNKIYENAFEWRFEFPEVLNEDGVFIGFDVVIGNPPYISNWDLSASNRSQVLFLEETYKPYLTGHWDLFGGFIIKSYQILKKSGYNSFILPTSFYKEKHSTELRKFFLENVSIIELIDFDKQVVFEDVARQTGVYLVNKTKLFEDEFRLKIGISDIGRDIQQSFYKRLKNYAFKTNVNNNDIEIYQKLNSNSILLGNLVCINTGVVAHSKVESPIKFTKDSVIYDSYKDGYKKYVEGLNISPYSIKFDNQYIDYTSNVNYFHRAKYPQLFESEKIIVRRISGKNNSFFASLDISNYYSNDNLMHVLLWNEDLLKYQKPEKKWTVKIIPGLSLQYILAILNSRLNTYYFSKFLSTDTLQGSYSSIYPEDIRQIPVKIGTIQQQKTILSLVDSILSIRASDPAKEVTMYIKEIDQLVYQLYNLTDEEIKIVEGEA